MEAEQLLSSEAMSKFQRKAWFRKTVAVVLIVLILGLTGYFVYGLIPKQYTLTITGGDILGNRHLIAKVLKDEAASYGVNLIIQPTEGSVEATRNVSEGKLDIALVQSGLEDKLPNVEHVATLPAEVTHFLVKPDIREIEDLKGKVINTGSKSDGTRLTTKQVLDFSNLEAGVDYIETNYSFEQLVKMKADKLPDAIVNISYSPSFVADYLVKERGYTVLELPFPPSLALRYGWVGDGAKILAYTYNTIPPVPATDIAAVGVNLQMIANSNVQPEAVSKLLEVLYSPTVVNRINQKVDESNITTAASYPISKGTVAYLKRNESFFSQETMEQLKNLLGLLFTLGSSSLIVLKWLKGGRLDDDLEFKEYIALVSAIEKEIGALEQQGGLEAEQLMQLAYRLTALKSEALEKYNRIKLKDPALMDTFLSSVADTRHYVSLLMERVRTA
ncbi:TAXI family TRAP transporter solute-binding subunit [Paenibacillus oceani]|uniref:Uncharacterized protein n=1 Tax=Paenibacillus oceani TaxID=2772510 RepID=A0A927CDC8_9BACL|nr:TAXI family TRAP transporter solute-binding subunit [Paenibacillus oceani]MBD2864608.1 hypothetical protein [Paenibacillus oceani]